VEKGTQQIVTFNPGCFSTGRMPRTARASVDDMGYHVLNRGNRREAAFRTSPFLSSVF
jgi:hypothetical protein